MSDERGKRHKWKRAGEEGRRERGEGRERERKKKELRNRHVGC